MRGDQRALTVIVAAVVLLHALGLWLCAQALSTHPTLFALDVAAYALGVRHAFDVDHIVAVDDTVRYLVHRGQRSVDVGFFFSLGHSTVVLVLVAVLAGGASVVAGWLPTLRALGGGIGTMVSILFLLSVGFANLSVLHDLGGSRSEATAPRQYGVISRLLGGPLRRWVTSGWRMYPVGFLFGLGFDTASEVALLALTAGATAGGLPVAATLSLPLLFAAAMSAVDTIDGVLMTRAYRWAAVDAGWCWHWQRLMTGLSVISAFVTAAFECCELMGELLGHAQGLFWIDGIDPSRLGIFAAAILALPWMIVVCWASRRRHAGLYRAVEADGHQNRRL